MQKKQTINISGILFFIGAIIFLPRTSENDIILNIAVIEIFIFGLICDIKKVDKKIEIIFLVLAVIDLLYAISPSFSFLFITLSFILVILFINVYCSVGRIHGTNTLYSLVTFGSLFWVNSHIEYLLPNLFFLSILVTLSILTFLCLLRQFVCFIGNIGEFSIPFIISFLLITLIIKTNSYYWLFFLAIYFIETFFTISNTFFKKTFANRYGLTFFQYLVNKKGFSRLQVFIFYALIQGIINLVVIRLV